MVPPSLTLPLGRGTFSCAGYRARPRTITDIPLFPPGIVEDGRINTLPG
ncbi:MAG: hypothetical protein KA314_18170 [Chloroflexi bacterium]|nr:hypothetical protein [Chloroflexota bacterium]MBP8057759.1 hypothetical protein [Chloroflexota bacterium]